MFFEIEKKNPGSAAAISDTGDILSYGQLMAFTEEFCGHIAHRTLLFILCRNCMGALKGYVSCLSGHIVPLLLDAGLDGELLEGLIRTYRPEYLWLPQERGQAFSWPVRFAADGYVLLKTDYKAYEMHPDLGLLLTTSGSTGTAKLVRQSYANILANAGSILSYLELNEKERPVTSLPMSYTYGLSVINSHLLAGATILLTGKSLMEQGFWQFAKDRAATSLAGVPYTYEMLKKLRFFRMDLPSVKTLTQAGGALPLQLHREFAEKCAEKGIRFYVMYGQTEATARMSYLPWQRSLEKSGSIGIAIPGGRLSLIDEEGREIGRPGQIGELVYEGPNVTMGYALTVEDLVRGDLWKGRLLTGDLARFDEEGYYYIAGRKKRFLKLYGKRVNPDECESLLRDHFGIECACAGRDDLLGVFLTDGDMADICCEYLAEKLGMTSSAFTARILPEIPKNEAGKIQYKDLVL